MPLWGDVPRLAGPPATTDITQVLAYVKTLANTVALMAKDLEFIVNGNLDVNNIAAKAITAEKIDVGELSAISANLGHITAGLIESIQIFGSYIATRQGAYPRAEMSSAGDVFAAYTNANNYIAIESDYAGVPSLNFVQNGTIKGRLDTINTILEMVGVGGLSISASGGSLDLNASSSVTLPSWYKFLNISSGRTLGQDLSEIFDRLEALESGA